MTEYELEDLLTGCSLASVETFGMYLTVMVAYLVSSYAVGKQLSRIQVTTISTLFTVTSLVFTWAVYGYISRGIPIANELSLINPDRVYGLRPIVRMSMLVVQICGILASLSFMWSIRHPKH
jgi:hypothetical protein